MTKLQRVFAELTHAEAMTVWEIIAGATEDMECDTDAHSSSEQQARLELLQRISGAMDRAMQ